VITAIEADENDHLLLPLRALRVDAREQRRNIDVIAYTAKMTLDDTPMEAA